MDQDEAILVLDIIEAATDGNWPQFRDALLERGYTPDKIVEFGEKLADVSGMSNPFSEEDF